MILAPAVPPVIPGICLLLHQCLDGTDPGTTPSSTLHSPPSFPVATSGPSSLPSSASGTSQHLFLCLASYRPPAMSWLPDSSELFHGGAGGRQPPGHLAPAGLVHLPPWGTCLRRRLVALQGEGLHLREPAGPKREVLSVSRSCETSAARAAVPFQVLQKATQKKWGKTRDAMEARVVPEKNPTRALVDPHAPSCPPQTPSSVTSGGSFLNEEAKLIKKTVATCLTPPAGRPPCWALRGAPGKSHSQTRLGASAPPGDRASA